MRKLFTRLSTLAIVLGSASLLGMASVTPTAACTSASCGGPGYCPCVRTCAQTYPDPFDPNYQACVAGCPDQPDIACLCPDH